MKTINLKSSSKKTHIYSCLILLFILGCAPSSKRSDKTDENTVKLFKVKDVSFSMIFVRGGCFMMGESNPDPFLLEARETNTLHKVYVNDFYIGETEVTQALWVAVMGENPSYYEGGDLPVEGVSWEDCQEFVRKLNKITGENFRLPEECEWEYAARGGRDSQGYKYSGSNSLNKVGWYIENSGKNRLNEEEIYLVPSIEDEEIYVDQRDELVITNDNHPHKVKTKAPNELGVYDMSGNVNEWCNTDDSTYIVTYEDMSLHYYKIIRGGSWRENSNNCILSRKHSENPQETGCDLDAYGLRLAK